MFEGDLVLPERLDCELCGEAIGCHLADAVLLQQVGTLLYDNLGRERGLELPDYVEGRYAVLDVADCEREAVLAGAARGVCERVITLARDIGPLALVGGHGVNGFRRNERF